MSSSGDVNSQKRMIISRGSNHGDRQRKRVGIELKETIKDGWELAKLREDGEQNHESDCTINTNVAY